jgi:glycosyltransferase involved in cell wall biosynthesis
MKIGIVCFAWGKDNRGGLETHVSGLAKLFNDFGHQVFLHCINQDINNTDQYHTRSWKEEPFHITQMNYNYSDTRCLFDFQRVPQAEISLKDWIDCHQLDVIDFHHSLFYGIRAIRSCSKLVPSVVTLHDYWCLDPQCSLFGSDHSIIEPDDHVKWEENSLKASDRTLKSLESAEYYHPLKTDMNTNRSKISLKTAWIRYSNQMLAYASTIISPSVEAATVHHHHGITHNISVIENGLNLSYQRGQLAGEIDSTSGAIPLTQRIRMGLLGSVAPHKGQLRFCEMLIEENLQKWFKIEIHGPIPDNYQGDQSSQIGIQNLAEHHPEFLSLKGSYNKESLPLIFSNLDIIVMPSVWHEVYGFVAREALAYGLPVIVTDAGGLSGLSSYEGVFTLPMADKANWGHYIRQGLEEGPFFRWTYKRRQGLPVASDFIPSNRDCARKIESLYQHLVADHSNQFDNSTKPIPGSRPST